MTSRHKCDTFIADSSPLVILAKLGCFELLNKLFPRLYISTEVYNEVVVAGAGMPGASEVANAEWVETLYLKGHLVDLRAAFRQLSAHSYIDAGLLNLRLQALGLPRL